MVSHPKKSHQTQAFSTSDEHGISKIVSGLNNEKWIRVPTQSSPPISSLEAVSLKAMVTFVALKQGIDENRVGRNLSDRFNVATTERIPSERFEDAIRYLVDTLDATKKNH